MRVYKLRQEKRSALVHKYRCEGKMWKEIKLLVTGARLTNIQKAYYKFILRLDQDKLGP